MSGTPKQKSLILRIDPERMKALEQWAADEFRSVNSQLLYIIDQALRRHRRVDQKTEHRLAGNNTPVEITEEEELPTDQ